MNTDAVNTDAMICGFPIRDLAVAATVMRRSGIKPEDLRELCRNLDFAFNVVREELCRNLDFAFNVVREELEKMEARENEQEE
ncbi:MAG: hypothetical protein ACI3VM_09215 [Oscillospiraceae bacterium]